MQVCTETNPRILFEDFKFFAFTFLAIILVGARPSHLGALGAMVSLEKSAKKVTVTQTTNKTTWYEDIWTSSETKTKTNPDQKPANCESDGSLNSPEEQKRPIPTPAEKRKRLTNEETTIKRAIAYSWQKYKKSTRSILRVLKNQSRINSITIRQRECKK